MEKKESSHHVKMKIFIRRLISKMPFLNSMPKNSVFFFCVLALTGLCLITIYFDVIIEASFLKKTMVPKAQLHMNQQSSFSTGIKYLVMIVSIQIMVIL